MRTLHKLNTSRNTTITLTHSSRTNQRIQLSIRQLRHPMLSLHTNRLRNHPIRSPQIQIRSLHIPIHSPSIQRLQQRMSLLRRTLNLIHPRTPLLTKSSILLPITQSLRSNTKRLRKLLLRTRQTLRRSSTQPLQIRLLLNIQHTISHHKQHKPLQPNTNRTQVTRR